MAHTRVVHSTDVGAVSKFEGEGGTGKWPRELRRRATGLGDGSRGLGEGRTHGREAGRDRRRRRRVVTAKDVGRTRHTTLR